MTIQKEFIYKCKGYYKGYEHLFEYVDDNRKVDINTTGAFICKIKKWLNFFSKNKSKYLQDWNNYFKYHLIADGINPHIDEGQYYVKQNYQLLKPNRILTYNQALFLLLGLNAHELGRAIKDFPVLNGDEPIAKPFELEFWRTKQNQELKQSSFIVDGKITSEELLMLAKDNHFFRVKNKELNKKTIEKNKRVALINGALYDFLIDSKSKGKAYTVSDLLRNTRFLEAIKSKGITVIETGIDANKKSSDKKPNEITPTTLGDYLRNDILISDWWLDENKSIQKMIALPPKKQKL